MMQLIQVDQLFDFKTLELPKALLEVKVHTDQIDQLVSELAGRYTEIIEAFDEIREGDIVLFEKENAEDEKDRLVQINVGRGFYDADWEHQAVGTRPGDSVSLSALRGGGEARLIQIKRFRVPELTDAQVKDLQIPEINSIADYRSMIEQGLKDEGCYQKYQGLTAYVIRQMTEKSEYERSEASADREVMRRSLAVEWARQNHIVFNEETYAGALEMYRNQGVPEDVIETQLNYEEYLQIAPAEAMEEAIFDYFRNRFTYQMI